MVSLGEIIISILSRFFLFLGLVFSAKDFANIEYTNSNGDTLYAYVAFPPNYNNNTNETYPVAMVLHSGGGMNDVPVYFADLLAKEGGYVVIAPDLFRGIAAPQTFVPWNLLNVNSSPQDRVDSDVDAAIEYLEGLGTVDVPTLVSGPGFCFGGSQALELARRRSVGATVALYAGSTPGFQDPEDDEMWGLLGHSPILGIYGALDGAPSPEDVNVFESALQARNATYNITIYDDVGHSFVTPEAHESGDVQATAAWNQVMSFLEDFKETSQSSPSAIRDVQTVKRKAYHPSLSWILDHLTDNIYHKGHANPHQG